MAIWSRYITLLDIKRRVYWLRAFLAELEAATRSKPFSIRNDIVWSMILDARDKCVIDLYSLSMELRHGIAPKDPSARGNQEQLRKRGFFIELRDHHAAALSRVYTPHTDDDSYEIELGRKYKAEHFARLFPNSTSPNATPSDIEDLCETFRI